MEAAYHAVSDRRVRSFWLASVLAVTVALTLNPEAHRSVAAVPASPLPAGLAPGGPAPVAGLPTAPVLAELSGPPTRLRIPAIGVDTGLDPLGLDAAGALEKPPDFARPGWYAAGTAPGDVGPAVVAGHVDSRTGPAIFYRLHLLRPGDVVEVVRDGRWLRFEVQAVSRYAKDAFPTTLVYGPTPDPQLRLITCGGAFNRHDRSYVDNIVVSAVLTGW